MAYLDELQGELISDPQGLGYSSNYTPDHNVTNKLNADLLNEVGSEIIDVKEISPVDIQSAVDGAEYIALSDVRQRAWGAIVGLSVIEVKNTNIRGQIAQIWSVGTVTRTNLLALQTRKASRAEVLWGENFKVTEHNIHLARRVK